MKPQLGLGELGRPMRRPRLQCCAHLALPCLRHARLSLTWDLLYNGHSGYNLATGIFTCPVGGVYYFAYHVHVKGTNVGGPIRTMPPRTPTTAQEGLPGPGIWRGRAAAFRPNDQVWVQMLDQANGLLPTEYIHSSFSDSAVSHIPVLPGLLLAVERPSHLPRTSIKGKNQRLRQAGTRRPQPRPGEHRAWIVSTQAEVSSRKKLA